MSISTELEAAHNWNLVHKDSHLACSLFLGFLWAKHFDKENPRLISFSGEPGLCFYDVGPRQR